MALAKKYNGKPCTFRGWICGQCNKGLGLLGDSLGSIMKAVKYLTGDF